MRPATINLELAALKRSYSLAIKKETLSKRPNIEMLPVNNALSGFFEQAEIDRLLQHLPEYARPVVRAAYLTGWRMRSELLSRRVSDVRDGWLHLDAAHSKNGATRKFLLALVAELNQLIEAQVEWSKQIGMANDQINPDLFLHDDGSPIIDLCHVWITACARAGLQGRIPHGFRRTAVRNLDRAGIEQWFR